MCLIFDLMKRIAVISVASLYLLLSVGMYLHVDRCCETISTLFIVEIESDCCKKVVPPSSSCADTGCGDHSSCPTEEIYLLFDEDTLTSNGITVSQLHSMVISEPSDFDTQKSKSTKELPLDEEGPPDERLFLLHSSLILYA